MRASPSVQRQAGMRVNGPGPPCLRAGPSRCCSTWRPAAARWGCRRRGWPPARPRGRHRVSSAMATSPSKTHQNTRWTTGASSLPPAVIVSMTSDPESEEVTKNTTTSKRPMNDVTFARAASPATRTGRSPAAVPAPPQSRRDDHGRRIATPRSRRRRSSRARQSASG